MDIIIIENQDETRSRLKLLLDGHDDISVVADVESAEKALDVMSSAMPDMAILDLGLPGISGADAVMAIKTQFPALEILVFTIMEDDEKVFASLKAGASGYLLKDGKSEEILSAVKELRDGGAPMSFSIARKVLKAFRNPHAKEEEKGAVSLLSDRETEIIEMLNQGDSYKEIAYKLSLSIHTIHTHIKNIYNKLHVNSRAQAVYEARRKNIIN